MVLLRIASNEEEIINKAAEILLKEKLGIDINIKRSIVRWELINGNVIKKEIFLAEAKTKALLFQAVDHRFQTEFKERMPELYSLAIVNMDWDQQKQLTSDLLPV